MSQQLEGLGITQISGQLATRMPTAGVPEDGVADAIRSTLYAAKAAGQLDRLSKIIEAQADGDSAVLALIEKLRTED